MIPLIVVAMTMQPDPAALQRLFEEALLHRDQQYGAWAPETAEAARDLGMFLRRHGDPEGARRPLERAVQIDEKVFGASNSRTLADLLELADVSPPGEAEKLWLRAAESPDARTASRALSALGKAHVAANDRLGAEAFYRRALAKEESASGTASAEVALRLNALAQLVELKEGIGMVERALAIEKAVLGARDPETATTEANLAGMLVNAERYQEAIRLGSEALAVFRETQGASNPGAAMTAGILADAYTETGDRVGAEKMYRLAVKLDEQIYGDAGPQTANDRRALANFLRAIGKIPEAAELERKADTHK